MKKNLALGCFSDIYLILTSCFLFGVFGYLEP